MRLFLTFILILYASSSYAITLSRIPVDRLANKIKTITSPNNVLAPTTFALNSSDSLNALGHLLTIPIYAYNPALGIASSFALGYAGQANLKVKELYNEGKITDPALQALCDMIWPPPSNIGTIAASESGLAGQKIDCTGHPQCGPGKVALLSFNYHGIFGGYSTSTQPEIQPRTYWDSNQRFNVIWGLHQLTTGGWAAHQSRYSATIIDGSLDSSEIPQQLSDSQASQLVDKIVEHQNEPGVRDAVNNLIKNNPDHAQYPDNISYNDINNYYTTNNQTVNNEYISNLQNLVNQYPDNPQLQQELAKAQAEKEKEPHVDIPGSFYTPICDLSQKTLAECLNYQQVINASFDFQSTALYQFPNLILDCLGYVEGDGCTYPPTITIDFQNRFTSDPIVIDMAPFSPVVQVMKFFFSLLVLVATGKAVMVLFGGGV